MGRISRSPTRGAQGNALKTIIAMPFVIDPDIGDVLEVTAKGVRQTIACSVDRIRQEPVIGYRQHRAGVKIGTAVRVRWPDSARSNLEEAKTRFLQIADDFTWLNPHLTLKLNWFGEGTIVGATNSAWKKWKPSDPTSPHWYGVQHFEGLIAAYLAHDQDNGRKRTVREFISEFRGLSGTAKQKAVLDMTGLSRAPLSRLMNGHDLNSEIAKRLLAGMRMQSRPVKARELGIIGEEHLRRRCEAAGREMASFQYRKMLLDNPGQPAVIEAAFGWRHSPQASRRLVTGVNCSPAIVNPFRQLDYQSLDTILRGQYAAADEPVIVVLHVALPRAQYTDRGKSAVVMGKETAHKIAKVVEDVSKKWAKQRKAEERNAAARRNRQHAMTRSPARITLKDAAWEVMEAAYLKASANGTLPAHARQIMYAARPHIQDMTGRDLDDKYFTQSLLPDYIEAHRDQTCDWNVVFDARGHLHEPHTERKIPLGTIEIRNYLGGVASHAVADPSFDVREERYPTFGPRHRYGAILFIEKEGFWPLFKAVKLAERYDIAVMSTKGMSVTACRELVDMLGARVLVLHDFDKSGFSIVGTLRRDTRRYSFENKIDVIDLGMRIGDIDGLQSEAAQIPDKAKAAARRNLKENGATPEEIEYLLEKRVELNAFTSDALVRRIEGKLAAHGVKKVVPDDATLDAAYRRAREWANIQKLIDNAVVISRKTPTSAAAPIELRASITKALEADVTRTWDSVVIELAEAEARKATLAK